MSNNNKLIQGSGPKILGLGSKINTVHRKNTYLQYGMRILHYFVYWVCMCI